MSEMTAATHRSPDCPGEWSMVANRHPALWECDACGARLLDEPEVRQALRVETQLGAWLVRLTAEGAAMVARGREG
ncbi:MAG TPA: hypothetical protein VFJ16_12185 [Longimicrobium sp.]|nr:hypothetical protein [Longimicrobium sp.]